MAHLDEVPGGWKVRWREGGRGSPQLASPVFDSEAKARDFADDLTAKLDARRALSRSRSHGAPIGLAELGHRWAASRVAERRCTALYAARVAAWVARLVAEMGWRTVADITPAEVDRWRAGSVIRNAGVGASLRAILRWSEERLRQPVPEGTFMALRPPRSPRRARRDLPAAADLRRWLRDAEATSPSAGALVHCLATYGWRPVTAARMLVGDYDQRRGLVTLRGLKGGGDDLAHPILPETAKRLRALAAGRAASEPLFLDPRTGLGWMRDGGKHGIGEWWRKNVDRVRGVYDLKRHAISGMLARGLPPQDVALFTGHKTLSQVLRYARTNEERARAALGSLAPPRPRAAQGARREHGGRSVGTSARARSA